MFRFLDNEFKKFRQIAVMGIKEILKVTEVIRLKSLYRLHLI